MSAPRGPFSDKPSSSPSNSAIGRLIRGSPPRAAGCFTLRIPQCVFRPHQREGARRALAQRDAQSEGGAKVAPVAASPGHVRRQPQIPELVVARPVQLDRRDLLLFAIAAVVLALAVLAEGVATVAGEEQRGGVEEHHVDRAEQIPASSEQFLLDEVFDAPRRGGIGLAFTEGPRQASPSRGTDVAEPRSRPALRNWSATRNQRNP